LEIGCRCIVDIDEIEHREAGAGAHERLGQ